MLLVDKNKTKTMHIIFSIKDLFVQNSWFTSDKFVFWIIGASHFCSAAVLICSSSVVPPQVLTQVCDNRFVIGREKPGEQSEVAQLIQQTLEQERWQREMMEQRYNQYMDEQEVDNFSIIDVNRNIGNHLIGKCSNQAI